MLDKDITYVHNIDIDNEDPMKIEKIANKTSEDIEALKEALEHNAKLNKYIIIKNCVVVICFTVLAIVFKHWWIVLFSGLLFSMVKKGADN